MTDIEENNKPLEENEPTVDIAGNDISTILLKRFEEMENKLYELSKPPVKKKREPTEKQKLALENARVKKMENFAIRKQLKEDKKKELKEKSKQEVEEYKSKVEIKPEPIVEENVTKIIDDIPITTAPEPLAKSRAKPIKTYQPANLEYNTYDNQPNRKDPTAGRSARDKMNAMWGSNKSY